MIPFCVVEGTKKKFSSPDSIQKIKNKIQFFFPVATNPPTALIFLSRMLQYEKGGERDSKFEKIRIVPCESLTYLDCFLGFDEKLNYPPRLDILIEPHPSIKIKTKY